MGFVEVPEQPQPGRNFAVLELDRSELAQTVKLLKSALHHLTQHSNRRFRFCEAYLTKAAPAPYTPSLHSLPRSSLRVKVTQPFPTVNVITPSVAVLQQRLGRDLGLGLGVGLDVGTPSLSLSSIDAPSVGDQYKPDKLPTPIARPRSPVWRTLQRTGGPFVIASTLSSLQNGYRNSMSGHSKGVLESSMRLLGIGDEPEPSGVWRDGGDQRKILPGRQLEIGEGDEMTTFNQPGIAHVGMGKSIWQAQIRAEDLEGIYLDGNRKSHLQGGCSHGTPGHEVHLEPDNGFAGVRKGRIPFGQSVPVSTEPMSGENSGSGGRIVPEKLGISTSEQLPDTQGRFDKPVGTSEKQRFCGTGSTEPENPSPVPPGPKRNTEWPAGMEMGAGAQAWISLPGCQGGVNRLQTEANLIRVSEQATLWRRRWTTAATEHNRECVTGMVYLPVLEGLEGGDCHSGWLVSTSRCLLNLWECNSYIRSTEPALQVMHSQATEFVMESMDVDSAAKVFLAFCAHPRDQGYCISLHSLSAESFFAYKGMIRVPLGVMPSPAKQGISSGSKFSHVTSLQPLGGPLRSSFAATIGGDVLVYELSSAMASPSANVLPKAQWKAHSSPISAIHRSPFACALFTGASDGCVRLWDLKTKPNVPVREYTHTKQVTQILMLDPNTVGSCGIDGMVNIWDIRFSSSAVLAVVPDRTSVIHMAVSPSRKTLALTTRRGLYCWELAGQAESASYLSPLMPLPPAGPCIDMRWNEKTEQLYICGLDGTIDVFRKS